MLTRLALPLVGIVGMENLENIYSSAEKTPFADNDAISDWARISVWYMQLMGVMGGTGDNMFSPKDPYTREQSIVTASRLFTAV